MVRASHTLCGIHRTGGFPVVATTAKALEQTLIALEQHGAPLPGTAQPVLARAIAGLALFVSRIKRQAPFTHGDVDEASEIQRELDELRQEAATEAGDAEAAAALVARLEEESVSVAPEPGAPTRPSHPRRSARRPKNPHAVATAINELLEADAAAPEADVVLPMAMADPLAGPQRGDRCTAEHGSDAPPIACGSCCRSRDRAPFRPRRPGRAGRARPPSRCGPSPTPPDRRASRTERRPPGFAPFALHPGRVGHHGKLRGETGRPGLQPGIAQCPLAQSLQARHLS